MSQTLHYTTALSQIRCGDCQIPFAIPSNMQTERRRDGKGFYCPNGHVISYHETEYDRLLREKAELERRVASEQENARAAHAATTTAKRSAAAARGQVTKIKKRVHNGVCPHCNRTFANVARHMASKHAEVPV